MNGVQIGFLVVAVVVGPYLYLVFDHAREQEPGKRLPTFVRASGTLGMMATFVLGLGLPVATFLVLEALFFGVWLVGTLLKGRP